MSGETPIAFIRVPTFLLKPAGESLRFFREIPWLNREQKRQIATDIRKKGIPKPVRGRALASDDEFVRDYCLDPLARFGNFWGFFGKVLEANRTKGVVPSLSLDFYLLESFMPAFWERLFERSAIEADVAGRLDLDRLVERTRDDCGTRGLVPLMLWPEVKLELERWDQLDAEAREKVLGAIFALDGVSRSRAFSSTAADIRPEVRGLLDEWPTSVDVAQLYDLPVDGQKAERDGVDRDAWGTIWDSFETTVRELVARGRASAPSETVAKRARDLVDAVVALSVELRGGMSRKELASQLLEALGQAVSDLPVPQGSDWEPASAWKEIRGGWECALSGPAASPMTDRDIDEIKRATKAVAELAPWYIEKVAALDRAAVEVATLSAHSPDESALEKVRKQQRHDEAESRRAQLSSELSAMRVRLLEAICTGDVSGPGTEPTREKSPDRVEHRGDAPIDTTGRSEPATEPAAASEPPAAVASPPLGEAPHGEKVVASTPPSPASERNAETTPAKLPQRYEPVRPVQREGEGLRVPHAPSSPDGAPSGPSDDPFSPEAGEACRPVWTAIERGYRALAYHLARALRDRHPRLIVPPPDLVKAYALADEVQSSHGEIAAELGRVYLTLDRRTFNEGPEPWRVGLGLLLVAATLRPSLVAPGTGAFSVSEYAHIPGRLDALYDLRTLLGEAGQRLQGQTLNVASFRVAHDAAGWHAMLESCRSEVQEWLVRAAKRTIKFAPATDVWRRLVQPSGQIGGMLDAIARWQPDIPAPAAAIREVQERIAGLENQTTFEELVHKVDRQELKRQRGDDIHARAMTQLRERASEALELARQWLDLVEARPEEGGYLEKEIGALRTNFARLLPRVRGELDVLVAEHGDGWPLHNAGARALIATLANVEQLLALDASVREPEADPGQLVGAPLLLLADVRLNADWTPAGGWADVLVPAEALLASGIENWRAAAEQRLERGDIDGAERIAEILSRTDPDLAEQISGQKDQALEIARMRLRAALATARQQLEGALAYGYFNEQQRATSDAKLVSIEDRLETIRQFAPGLEEIAGVCKAILTAKEQKLAEINSRIVALGLDLESPAGRKLKQVCAAGDALTANEYLQRLAAGEEIATDEPAAPDAFDEFFPRVARELEEYLDKEAPKANQLSAAIENRASLGPLRFGGLGAPRVQSARDIVSHWLGLKRTVEPSSGPLVDSLRVIFDGIGFNGARLQVTRQTRGRAEVDMDADVIADRRVCAVPHFGSEAKGRYRVVCLWERPNEEDLLRLVGDVPGGRPTIVLYFGRLRERQRRDLARAVREQRRRFLVLDEILLLALCAESRSRLSVFFSCTLPFAYIEPYTTTSGLVPPEMFYGRTDELNSVRDPNGQCFIYGGRQLGKTALLREAERSFHRREEGRIARWVDLKAEGLGYNRVAAEIWAVIDRELRTLGVIAKDAKPFDVRRKQAAEDLIQVIKRWLGGAPGRRILLLLDEADRFLEQDSREEFHETSRLKNLMDDTRRAFKIVFAGLHNVMRTTEQANHPLAHLGAPIEIGPLMRAGEWREARSLVMAPLRAAGYEFESDNLVVRILAQTNYYPSLIQLYCSQLLRQILNAHRRTLDFRAGPRYTITETVVDEAYQSRELREAIRSRFHLTLQLDPRYEVIAYSFALALSNDAFSLDLGEDPRRIKEEAISWWPEGFKGTTDHGFRIVLDEMVGLGVLRRVSDSPPRFSLRNPNVLLLMGTEEEIGEVLTRERDLPQEFEPSLFRPPGRGGLEDPDRSPLTFTQERELLREESGVTIVVGTHAAGLGSLGSFLEARIEAEHLRILPALSDRGSFATALDAALERRAARSLTLVLVDPAAAWRSDWIEAARGKLALLRSPEKPVRIVFVATPETLWDVQEHFSQFDDVVLFRLGSWHDKLLRHWLENLGFHDDQVNRRRLAAATGLWGDFLISLARANRGLHDASKLADAAESALADEAERERLRGALGLNDVAACRALIVLRELAPAFENQFEDLGALAEMDGQTFGRRMKWAESLGIAYRSGRDSWVLDPFAARILPQKGV
jgi:hypothetical protein